MVKWAGGSAYAKCFPCLEVMGYTPTEPIPNFRLQQGGATWHPFIHPQNMPHVDHQLFHVNLFHVSYQITYLVNTLCHVSSPSQRYSRIVSFHMDCMDCTVIIFLFWENGHNTISHPYRLCLILFKLCCDREDDIKKFREL
jgi:hypothetical protein